LTEPAILAGESLPQTPLRARWHEIVLPYALTIFASAFLLFQIQPVIAKIILPWFGGSAGVWTTCMLFFEIVLLLGYLYAHLSIRYLSPGRQAFLHIGLLLASLALLPAIPSVAWKPSGSEDPAFRILGLLAATIGLPYFLLSATSPMLQAWYSRTRGNAIPYRLFALSNAGSMLALLSYPILVEPRLTNRQQGLSWSAGYVVFALLCSVLALGARKARAFPAHEPTAEEVAKPGWKLQMLWLSLAACASALLLAVTNNLTQNVASIPFLWILPLALYLASFILCFEGRGWYKRYVFLPLAAGALGWISYLLAGGSSDIDLAPMIAIYATGLFASCMTCHGELARLKPDPRYLTSFYLMTALGGAVGGVLVGLVAPYVLRGYFELAIAMACFAFLMLFAMWGARLRRPSGLLLRALALASLVVVIAFTAYLAYGVRESIRGARLMVRDFYGALRVSDSGGVRELRHGTISHGEQFLDPDERTQPTTYYTPGSGVGLALRTIQRQPSLRVGVIGLGAGTLAAYGRRGDTYRFYDISASVMRIAATEFTYLKDSGARIETVLGDARLSLERERPQNFDLLAVDAFSGDAIPVHLLTRNALALYFRHLNKDGVLAVHVTNAYLRLAPVVLLGAESLGKTARLFGNQDDDIDQTFSSDWVLVSANPEFFNQPLIRHNAEIIRPIPKLRMWTDDYSNLFQVLGNSSMK
jgi:SAM-dependent methyltransferase